MRRVCSVLIVLAAVVSASSPARAAVPWQWPVSGAIVRGFDPPDDPYGSGHRGIDIAAQVGTVVTAPDDGVVTFAGKVGGRLFLTIDHGGGIFSTCSWLTSVLVHKNDHVVRGQPVATTGWGHTDLAVPHLHFGVRKDGTYVDPTSFLETLSVAGLIRLAPLVGQQAASAAAPLGASAVGRMTGLANPSPPPRVALLGARRLAHAGLRGRDVQRRILAAVPKVGGPHGRLALRTRSALPHRVVRPDGHR